MFLEVQMIYLEGQMFLEVQSYKATQKPINFSSFKQTNKQTEGTDTKQQSRIRQADTQLHTTLSNTHRLAAPLTTNPY